MDVKVTVRGLEEVRRADAAERFRTFPLCLDALIVLRPGMDQRIYCRRHCQGGVNSPRHIPSPSASAVACSVR